MFPFPSVFEPSLRPPRCPSISWLLQKQRVQESCCNSQALMSGSVVVLCCMVRRTPAGRFMRRVWRYVRLSVAALFATSAVLSSGLLLLGEAPDMISSFVEARKVSGARRRPGCANQILDVFCSPSRLVYHNSPDPVFPFWSQTGLYWSACGDYHA